LSCDTDRFSADHLIDIGEAEITTAPMTVTPIMSHFRMSFSLIIRTYNFNHSEPIGALTRINSLFTFIGGEFVDAGLRRAYVSSDRFRGRFYELFFSIDLHQGRVAKENMPALH
jgi:hypothetical protein